MSSRFRKPVVIIAGLALLVGLAAGPLAAASSTKKTYGVTVTPTTLDYSTPSITSAFTATYTNTTPGGTSTINSLSLTAPTGYTIDADPAPTFATSAGGSTGSLAASSTTITVTHLNPVSYGQSVTISFSATVADTTSLSCATEAGLWTTQAWTGATTSGTLFRLSSAAPATTIGTGTLLLPGNSIVVSGVTVTNNSTSPCGVPVTVTRSGNSVQILKPTIEGVGLTVDILWDPEPAVLPLPVDQVMASGSTTPGPIQWCDGTATTPAMVTGQVSCLVSESSQIYGADATGNQQVQVHDVIALLGDWAISR